MARSRLKVRLAGAGWAALVVTMATLTPIHPLAAQGPPIVIKLATLAPANSRWHDIYKEMGARWAEVSGGRVTLTVYPGGVAGEEVDVLRKMGFGQFQAGGLTLAGLTHVSSAVAVLALPFLARNPEELDRLMTAVGPRLEDILAQNGHIVLNWGYVGWLRFFVPKPDASVDALKQYRFLSWADSETSDLWSDAGFRQVVLNLADVLPGLQTGLVDAIGTTPLVVAANMWFPFVPYMLDIPWAPLPGATIIDKGTWERIPADLRPRLMEVARETGEQLQAEILELEAEAIREMEARGLTVVQPTPEELAEWKALFDSKVPSLRGTMIPADLFDEALRAVRTGRED